ncbi:MAG TPA: DnaJ domain-containing protein [Candidatus Limnocylindria bacterium]|nr:DnaJ domain-containing protein [Candidatus Limnocylindria bacterium]
MPSPPDPYRVLQVVPTCDQEVLHAAFRALARKYHPDRDGSRHAQARMVELNEAYALVREPGARERHDRAIRNAAFAPLSAGVAAPPPRSGAVGTRLEFGRYSGWTLRDLARHDPDYLRWLSRHASGLRYRTEIYGILGRMGATAA